MHPGKSQCRLGASCTICHGRLKLELFLSVGADLGKHAVHSTQDEAALAQHHLRAMRAAYDGGGDGQQPHTMHEHHKSLSVHTNGINGPNLKHMW